MGFPVIMPSSWNSSFPGNLPIRVKAFIFSPRKKY